MPNTRPSILIQLDVDPQPSVFDGIVAVDSGIDHLFRHGGVEPEMARDLVFGAMFTRGMSDLRRTAIFVGGSDFAAAEAVLKAVTDTFFGAFRVSVLFDANGSNTTAAAAVLATIQGMGGSVAGARVAVLAGTGPVGRRVARLLTRLGAEVAIGSRSADRAGEVAAAIGSMTGRSPSVFSTSDEAETVRGCQGASVVVAAGAAGIRLLSEPARRGLEGLQVAIDLNVVPPAGIEGIKGTDRDDDRDGVRCWGALGIGGVKMKIHKAALRSLFDANDRVLDAEQVFEIGRGVA